MSYKEMFVVFGNIETVASWHLQRLGLQSKTWTAICLLMDLVLHGVLIGIQPQQVNLVEVACVFMSINATVAQ